MTLVELWPLLALGGPVAQALRIGVDVLVDGAEQWILIEAGQRHHLHQEVMVEGASRVVGEGLLEQPVELLGAVTHAQHQSQALEAAHAQSIAVGQADIVVQQMVGDGVDPLAIIGKARQIRLKLALHSTVGAPVDLVGVGVERRQAAGDIAAAQSLGRVGQVGQGQKAAVALAQRGPGGALIAGLAQVLEVRDHRVGVEAGQVVTACLVTVEGGHGGLGDARTAPGATLVGQDHPIVLERLMQPSRSIGGGAWRLAAGATLQEQQQR